MASSDWGRGGGHCSIYHLGKEGAVPTRDSARVRKNLYTRKVEVTTFWLTAFPVLLSALNR